MKARLLLRNELKLSDSEDLWASLVIWQVPTPVRGSAHEFKYRLALVHEDHCVMRYDNEAGKGDHKHVGKLESSYAFSTIGALITDFMKDAEAYRKGAIDAHSDD